MGAGAPPSGSHRRIGRLFEGGPNCLSRSGRTQTEARRLIEQVALAGVANKSQPTESQEELAASWAAKQVAGLAKRPRSRRARRRSRNLTSEGSLKATSDALRRPTGGPFRGRPLPAAQLIRRPPLRLSLGAELIGPSNRRPHHQFCPRPEPTLCHLLRVPRPS